MVLFYFTVVSRPSTRNDSERPPFKYVGYMKENTCQGHPKSIPSFIFVQIRALLQ